MSKSNYSEELCCIDAIYSSTDAPTSLHISWESQHNTNNAESSQAVYWGTQSREQSLCPAFGIDTVEDTREKKKSWEKKWKHENHQSIGDFFHASYLLVL